MFWRGCVQLRRESYGFWIQGGEYRPTSAPKRKEKELGGRSNRKHRVLLLFLVCLLFGSSLGMARGQQEKGILDHEEFVARTMTGARILVRGVIKKAEQKENTITLMLEEVTAEAGRRTGKFRRMVVYAENRTTEKNDSDSGGELAVGVKVQVRGKLAPVEGPGNPGEFDFRTYYRTKGIACRLYGENLAVAGGEAIPYYKGIAEFRMQCAGVLEKICMPEDVAVFKAVLLGDTSDMNPEMRDMYQRNGISHLLAVSGQHLAIIGGGIYLMIRRAGAGYGKAGMISAVLVISYGIMTGSSGSAIRAVIMIVCLWLAAVKGRSYDTLSALGRRPASLVQTMISAATADLGVIQGSSGDQRFGRMDAVIPRIGAGVGKRPFLSA